MQKFLRLEFVPVCPDLALLVLRLWLGASLLWLHGWGKLLSLLHGNVSFANPIGLGQAPSLLLAIFAEVICSALLVLGLFTRFAALCLIIMLGVAFVFVHGTKLAGTGNGELAFIYLAGFVVLLLAGAGKYSVDKK